VRRSVYCTASFSVCSLRRAKFAIIYPDLRLDYKVATLPRALPSQTKRIIISPDRQLNFISFATLLTKDKQFLAQTYRILTAEDVSTLDLQGTWLVTLSACDTGSGEARAGEGVMGLRRGFIQAGAQNLLMTLWPISDEVTVQIMTDFYDAAHKTGNAPEALAEVQRNWLLKLRTDKGLAQAVNLAGPFIMSSQGKP
jgi:CHAT domain-containing protein